MNKTPQSNRLQVGIFGKTNAGKSSLFNALCETDIAIVSPQPGTTTDYVRKAMELTPFGPIVLYDTAGLGDETILGQKRVSKTLKLLNRIDFVLYVECDEDDCYDGFKALLEKKQIPHMIVHSYDNIAELKKNLIQCLSAIKRDDETILGDLLPTGSTVLMVVPIDSAAPKGRLILPQAQLIRDCLDNGIMAYVVTENDIEAAFANLKRVDLVVTDSQVFRLVASKTPPEIPLTSFSILMAKQKGKIEVLLEGIEAVNKLKAGDKVLISEVCTHNRTHEDIGREKIPAALHRLCQGDGSPDTLNMRQRGCQENRPLDIDFTTGRDFPEDLSVYDLIIHCGACMITSREMQNRIRDAREARVPITNYGLFLAYANGILERSIEVLKND